MEEKTSKWIVLGVFALLIGVLVISTVANISGSVILFPSSSDCGAFAKPITQICLDQLKKTDYRIEISPGEELLNAAGTATEVSSAYAISFIDKGRLNGFFIGGHRTNQVYAYYDKDTQTVKWYWKDRADGKIKNTNVFTLPGISHAPFIIKFGSKVIRMDVYLQQAEGLTLTLKETNSQPNLAIWIGLDQHQRFSYLGHSDGDANIVNDLKYGDADISSWTDNAMTAKGIVLYTPRTSAISDRLEFSIAWTLL